MLNSSRHLVYSSISEGDTGTLGLLVAMYCGYTTNTVDAHEMAITGGNAQRLEGIFSLPSWVKNCAGVFEIML